MALTAFTMVIISCAGPIITPGPSTKPGPTSKPGPTTKPGPTQPSGWVWVEKSCDDFYSNNQISDTIEVKVGDTLVVVLCSNPTTGFQ